jgi:predicted ATPase
LTGQQRRIVLTGASGVGKTSLATALAQRLNLSLVPEIARILCTERGYSNPAEIPDQVKFRQDVLERQVEAETLTGSFIGDRSTVDCWVMWQRWHLCTAMTYESEAYYQRCRAQAQTYTQIIYVPPLFTPVDDAFRWTEPDYIKQLDRLTRLTLYDWSLLDRTYTITSDGVDLRLLEVTRWLDSL